MSVARLIPLVFLADGGCPFDFIEDPSQQKKGYLLSLPALTPAFLAEKAVYFDIV